MRFEQQHKSAFDGSRFHIKLHSSAPQCRGKPTRAVAAPPIRRMLREASFLTSPRPNLSSTPPAAAALARGGPLHRLWLWAAPRPLLPINSNIDSTHRPPHCQSPLVSSSALYPAIRTETTTTTPSLCHRSNRAPPQQQTHHLRLRPPHRSAHQQLSSRSPHPPHRRGGGVPAETRAMVRTTTNTIVGAATPSQGSPRLLFSSQQSSVLPSSETPFTPLRRAAAAAAIAAKEALRKRNLRHYHPHPTAAANSSAMAMLLPQQQTAGTRAPTKKRRQRRLPMLTGGQWTTRSPRTFWSHSSIARPYPSASAVLLRPTKGVPKAG